MWDLEHSGSSDSKDLLLFTTSCKFRGDCSAFPLREFLKVLHTRTLEHPIPLGILAVVLPLGQVFAFTVSTGLLASSTMGETAHLTGSSCHSGRLSVQGYIPELLAEAPAWQGVLRAQRDNRGPKSFVKGCNLCSFEHAM